MDRICRHRSRSVCAPGLLAAALLLSLATPFPTRADEVPPPAFDAAVPGSAEAPASEGATATPESVRAVLDAATSHIGTPYKWGGNVPEKGFDCSGFVRYVFRQTVNVVLPRAARDLARIGTAVKKMADLRPGDLVFFNTRGRRNSHVGIYFGDSTFIHAPRRGKKVRIDHMDTPYFVKRFNGGRRLDASEFIPTFPVAELSDGMPVEDGDPGLDLEDDA